MNELGIRKLPRDDDGPDPDKVRPKMKEKYKYSSSSKTRTKRALLLTNKTRAIKSKGIQGIFLLSPFSFIS